MPSFFNRRDPPLFYLRVGGRETLEPQKEGQGVVGLGECPPAFPIGGLFWDPPNSGHPSRGDCSKAGNWAGPRKSPSGWQIPTGLEASGMGASHPDSLAPGVLCPPCVLQEENQRPREG